MESEAREEGPIKGGVYYYQVGTCQEYYCGIHLGIRWSYAWHDLRI